MSVILLRETAPLDAEICARPLLNLPPSPVRPHRAKVSAMPHLDYKSNAASTSSSASLLNFFPTFDCSPAVHPAAPHQNPRHPPISAALESDANICIAPPICLTLVAPPSDLLISLGETLPSSTCKPRNSASY